MKIFRTGVDVNSQTQIRANSSQSQNVNDCTNESIISESSDETTETKEKEKKTKARKTKRVQTEEV